MYEKLNKIMLFKNKMQPENIGKHQPNYKPFILMVTCLQDLLMQ